MRVWAVVGLVLLAGCAWAFAAEPSVVVVRAPATRFTLGPDAVLEALRFAGAEIGGSQVRLPGELTATVEHPELRVSGAERRGAAVVVRLRCAGAGECLPFFAEIAAGDVELATQMAEAMQTVGHGTGAPAEMRAKEGRMAGTETTVERGVVVGARIRLELRDRQMRIVLPAVAVDAGAPGTEVRVASLDRKHTYRGVVVDAGTVRGGVE